MRSLTRWAAGAALAAVAAISIPEAEAAITAKTGNIELFAGYYFPEDDVPDENLDDLTYGVRGGFSFTQAFMLQFGAQGFSTDYDTVPGQVDIDQWMLDVSFGWTVNPEDKAVFMLYGGPGWVNTDVDFPVAKDDSDSSFSAHVGIAGLIQVGKRFYLRPDARVRWIDGDDDTPGDDDDRTEWEASLGFGWALGNVE